MKLLFTLLILSGALCAFAHGDLDVRIKKVSKQIEKEPNSADLYIKRGDLYYQHEEYAKSILDFEQAKQLGDRSDHLFILFTRSYIKTKEHDHALDCINTVLIKDEQHVQANRWKGKLLVDQGQYLNAALALETALEHSVKKMPDQFLEIARVYKNVNTEAGTIKACETIKDGIESLGVLPVFISKLVEYYSSISRFDEAIEYQTQLIDLLNRKERAYYHRAKLYIEQNKLNKAKQDLNRALTAINKLPPKAKKAKAINNLIYEIEHLHTSIN